MPEISRFFGLIIRMFYDDHEPPHVHVEYQGFKAKVDFSGNVLAGGLKSKSALRLVRDWIDEHTSDLERDWALAREGKPLEKIPPLD
jgi:Domain of unknown function (DUF4160)